MPCYWQQNMGPDAIIHHTDSFQRYIKIGITSQTASSLDVQVQANGDIAPPGFYMVSSSITQACHRLCTSFNCRIAALRPDIR